MSYKQNVIVPTSIEINNSYEGERLEDKLSRMMNNKEPIKDGSPLIFTDRKDGVRPEFDIRTDRFEVAIDAMDKVDKSNKAKREQRIGEKTFDTMTTEQQTEFHKKFPNNKHNKGGETPSTQGGQEA